MPYTTPQHPQFHSETMSNQLQNLVETVDESTPYEKINTTTGLVHPPEKQTGQLGGGAENASTGQSNQKSESRRYGENISEHGLGGHTTSLESETKSEGFGGTTSLQDETNQNARTAQGYSNPETETREDIGA